MRKVRYAWVLTLLLCAVITFGQVDDQNIFPFKDMVFPQVAAGGAYESWITVTNHGTAIWRGSLEFYRGAGVRWNPVVNMSSVVGGTLTISIDPGVTMTYKVTLPGSTEAGYAILISEDLNLQSFIEGNLTYYISVGTTITDSVGVLPARQFLVSSLPFEDFNSVALAFANTDPMGRPASLEFRVFSDANVQVGQTKYLPLINMEHSAQYLNQLIPGITLGRGRLEIESDVPVSGVALTQAPGNQFSSLPLESTTRTYVVDWISGHPDFMNRMILWSEGFYVKGYLEILLDKWTLFAVSGQINQGELHLHFDSYDFGGWFGYLKSDGVFALGQQKFVFDYYGAPATVSGSGGIEHGTFRATLVP